MVAINEGSLLNIAYIQDYQYVNEDTREIVDAINKSGQANADKIGGMQKSISELARSVHELATSNNYLSKDVESIQVDVKDINKRLNAIEPTANTMKTITAIFLRWMIPVMLIGSFGGGLAYTLFK